MFRHNLIPVWIGIILLSCMFLMGQGGECPWGAEVVEFPDPSLDYVIRRELKKWGNICTSDLLLVWQISDSWGYGISDLSGLERCKVLFYANFAYNHISDLSPLVDLPGLDYLELQYNQISDIYPLAENSGIGDGDDVDLRGNPLGSTSCDVYIPELESRGVTVDHDCP